MTAPIVKFIPGLQLSELFYLEAVKPILDIDFKNLKYSAALIGSGSEILGFDTEMSSDHHWGPRLMLFLIQSDFLKYKVPIKNVLSEKLPRKFKGYPTSYSDPQEKGIQLFDTSNEGPINHRVDIMTIDSFIETYLGFEIGDIIEETDWLTFPEQKLLSITSGRVFYDQVGLEQARDKFAYYPHDVWLYQLASCWSRIEQEEHLMGRAGSLGDEIGAAIISSRLVRDIMRLCFLMEQKYTPYPKWFGIAFSKLNAARRLEPILEKILSTNKWIKREECLSAAYEYVASLHNSLNITEPMPTKVSNFFDRPFQVISMGRFSKAIIAKIRNANIIKLAERPLIGSIDLVSDNTDILSDPYWRTALLHLYTDSTAPNSKKSI